MTYRQRTVDILVSIVILGSIWGFLEATLGGTLHLIHFPHKGVIMGGIGMSIMATFVATTRRPSLVIWVGFIAALFKGLDALILGGPIFAPFVVNPATAIILEAMAFSMVIGLLFRKFENSIKVRAGAGVLAGYLSIILYAVIASGAGLGKWVWMSLGEKVNHVLIEGTGIAVVGGGLLLLGYLLGISLRPRLEELRAMRPRLFYTGALTIGASCWIVSAVAFAGGL
ncbi:MAG: hypothetical protein ABID84_02200 [Chloroflexota bacterium]